MEAARSSAGLRKSRHKRLYILLIDIERRDENDDPKYDGRDEAPPLMAPNGAQHIVIIFRECVYLRDLLFQFWVHISNILAPLCSCGATGRSRTCI